MNTKDYTYGLIKILVLEVRAKYVDFDGRGIKVGPLDDHGHGTHVAGTIAGGSSSGRSIGVAPVPIVESRTCVQ